MMTNYCIDDFDLMTIEDVNALMGIEEIDYDDYEAAFAEAAETENDPFTFLDATDVPNAPIEDLPF